MNLPDILDPQTAAEVFRKISTGEIPLENEQPTTDEETALGLDLNNLPEKLTPRQAQILARNKHLVGKAGSGSAAGVGAEGSVTGLGTEMNPSRLPVSGRISQKYGVPVGYEKSGRHGGVDIAIPSSTPIPDVVGGTVIGRSSTKGGFGNSIIVKGNDGTIRRYSHLSQFKASMGDKVKAGQIIGLSGNTGLSSGPHLDYREYK
jgi:murein DD-endopeptidase MepM/ murein hydrolase activator NlpD